MDYYGIPANFVGYHRQLFTWDSPDLVTSSGWLGTTAMMH